MKNEIAFRIENLVRNSLFVEGDAQVLTGDGFSGIEFRGKHGEHSPVSSWSVQVTSFNELTLFDFSFDDEAKNWNDFYLGELRRNLSSWEQSFFQMLKNGFEIDLLLDGKPSQMSTVQSLKEFPRFSLTGKLRLEASPEANSYSLYIASIRDFVSLCILPLIPQDGDSVSSEQMQEMGLPEGALAKVVVNKYERNPRNRAACLAYFGFNCYCCSFDFGSFYGDFAEAYIHVHHITPVSLLGEDYVINPIKDLIPLCPNCHAAIHISNPPLQPDELKSRIQGRISD